MKNLMTAICLFFFVCGLVSCQATQKQRDHYDNELRKNDEAYDPNSPLNKEHDPYNFENLKK